MVTGLSLLCQPAELKGAGSPPGPISTFLDSQKDGVPRVKPILHHSLHRTGLQTGLPSLPPTYLTLTAPHQ